MFNQLNTSSADQHPDRCGSVLGFPKTMPVECIVSGQSLDEASNTVIDRQTAYFSSDDHLAKYGVVYHKMNSQQEWNYFDQHQWRTTFINEITYLQSRGEKEIALLIM